ncbi:MAG TPA: metalloregulator ArsR/SmtB family transcription factor [Mycobacteriales bacterium]|nr:metalloregulator ArsR/SmtB family transcription factor [Mycobacteriales bacterium]
MSTKLAGQPLPLLDTASCCRPSLAGTPVDPRRAERLAAVFRALGDPVRLRLVSLIASHPGGEVCVCELVGAFDLTQPTISHHLRVLRQAGLVDCERRGTWAYYRTVPDTIAALGTLFEAG